MIFNSFERMVAFRYLRARKKEGSVSIITALTLVGITLGVGTLIIVMSVMNGFHHELLGRILGVNGHINIYAPAGYVRNYDDLAGRIRNLPDITSVTPLVEGQALVSENGVASGGMIRGIDPKLLAEKPVVSTHIVAGSLNDFTGDRIVVGARLADRFGVRVGDKLTLVSPQSKDTPFGSIPRSRSYKIAAIFDIGMYEYDSAFIFMPIDAAQLFFDMDGQVTSLEVTVPDPDKDIAIARKEIHGLNPDLRLIDWQQSNGSFFTAIMTEKAVMFLILSLMIVIAVINIISSMIMMVRSKTRHIAILRTMGATRGSVLRIFMLTGTSIGIVGTAMGLVLGVAFADNIETIRQGLQHLTGTNLFSPEIYFLSTLPAILDWNDAILIVVIALASTFIATVIPAISAARLDPVEALRYE